MTNAIRIIEQRISDFTDLCSNDNTKSTRHVLFRIPLEAQQRHYQVQ